MITSKFNGIDTFEFFKSILVTCLHVLQVNLSSFFTLTKI
jgi:hypothetical protein